MTERLGTEWDGAVFTNLSRDHLDLHGTMEEYAAVKFRLFSEQLQSSSKEEKIAVINIEDATGREYYKALKELPGITCVSYSASGKADFSLARADYSLFGTELLIAHKGEEFELSTRLIGGYNASNTLAAFAYFLSSGVSATELNETFQTVQTVPGRLERVSEQPPHVFVDYAHTPEALLSVQSSLRPLVKGKLITVFGCGGDRDSGKRPEMAAAVESLSDLAIATSDNPRTEDPEHILNQVCAGFRGTKDSYFRIENRSEAIRKAIYLAAADDAVLIAGKGHEPYQDIAGVKHPFDDREIARKWLNH